MTLEHTWLQASWMELSASLSWLPIPPTLMIEYLTEERLLGWQIVNSNDFIEETPPSRWSKQGKCTSLELPSLNAKSSKSFITFYEYLRLMDHKFQWTSLNCSLRFNQDHRYKLLEQTLIIIKTIWQSYDITLLYELSALNGATRTGYNHYILWNYTLINYGW